MLIVNILAKRRQRAFRIFTDPRHAIFHALFVIASTPLPTIKRSTHCCVCGLRHSLRYVWSFAISFSLFAFDASLFILIYYADSSYIHYKQLGHG